MTKERIIPFIFFAIGILIMKSLWPDIGIIGYAIAGAVCAGIGGAVSALLLEKTNKKSAVETQEEPIREDESTETEVAATIDPETISNTKSQPKYLYGFGGWLILYAIGLIVAVIRSGIYVLDQLVPLVTSADFADLIKEEPSWGVIIFMEFFAHLAIIALIILIGYFCFKQSKSFVKFSKYLLVFDPLIAIIAYFVYLLVPETAETSTDTLAAIFKSVIYSAIWFAYFSKSKRVANTYL